MSLISSVALVDTPSALPTPAPSIPCSSVKSSHAGASSSRTNSLEFQSTMMFEPLNQCPQTFALADHHANAPVLPPPSMVNAQVILSGLTCCAPASTHDANGLSWSSPSATRNGKPKSRAVWRDLASTQPGLSLRLAILVRLIYAGECSFLPTPVSRDSRSPGRPSHPRLNGTRGQPLPETLGTRLHPEVCEWLMGLPVGWTEMLPSRQLEIPIRQEWQPSSDGQSSEHP